LKPTCAKGFGRASSPAHGALVNLYIKSWFADVQSLAIVEFISYQFATRFALPVICFFPASGIFPKRCEIELNAIEAFLFRFWMGEYYGIYQGIIRKMFRWIE
jgi:hypothetical protein